MPLLIGMDEAGYGPNLGPLVVSVVVFEVPEDPRKLDLWSAFDGVVTQKPASRGTQVQIADSKTVYSPARGLGPLESGVLAAFALWQAAGSMSPAVRLPATFHALCAALCDPEAPWPLTEPWFCDTDLPIPHVSNSEAVSEPTTEPGTRGKPSRTDRSSPIVANFESDVIGFSSLGERVAAWQARCADRGIRLRSMHSDVVSPARFNGLTRRHGSKGRALSELSMRVLGRALWQAAASNNDPSALIIADKHGGRNRYHEFLPIVFGDRFVCCRDESLESSRYEAGRVEIRFESKSERHLPVALASMLSKYVRELAMVLFNRFWQSHQPGLAPTAGYPLDAKRFRDQIAHLLAPLGIDDDVLWRER